MPSANPQQESRIFAIICVGIGILTWGIVTALISNARNTPRDISATARPRDSMSDTVTHATDSNVAKQKKPGDDTPTAHTPPPPSRERKSSDKGRRFRDGNGSVIYENIAEEKLQELRDSIYAMPGGRKRDSYEQALKICEAEWERIKQQGPID